MKNKSLFIGLLSFTFLFVLCLSSAQNVSAQRYLTELKPTGEIKGIAKFAGDLSEFLTLAESLDTAGNSSATDLTRLEASGKKVKDGTPNFRQSIENLIAKIKRDNKWNDEFDSEVTGSLQNRKIKGFFQNNGGRKILSESLVALNNLSRDVDLIIANARKQKSASNGFNEEIFVRTSFASSSSARKVRFKCVLLGAAIFGAEVIKADRTAENLDGIFDKSCGAGASTAT